MNIPTTVNLVDLLALLEAGRPEEPNTPTVYGKLIQNSSSDESARSAAATYARLGIRPLRGPRP